MKIKCKIEKKEVNVEYRCIYCKTKCSRFRSLNESSPKIQQNKLTRLDQRKLLKKWADKYSKPNLGTFQNHVLIPGGDIAFDDIRKILGIEDPLRVDRSIGFAVSLNKVVGQFGTNILWGVYDQDKDQTIMKYYKSLIKKGRPDLTSLFEDKISILKERQTPKKLLSSFILNAAVFWYDWKQERAGRTKVFYQFITYLLNRLELKNIWSRGSIEKTVSEVVKSKSYRQRIQTAEESLQELVKSHPSIYKFTS